MKYCKIMELNWVGFEMNDYQEHSPLFISSFWLSDQH